MHENIACNKVRLASSRPSRKTVLERIDSMDTCASQNPLTSRVELTTSHGSPIIHPNLCERSVAAYSQPPNTKNSQISTNAGTHHATLYVTGHCEL
jgi:hypothetical protein